MNTDASLFEALITGNARKVMNELFPPGPQQPMSRYPDLVEGPSPTADPGTAGVGILYPVTCAARYYDAASQILEDEPNLFTHENADELGHVIQKWIEETRDNWEPR